jgi:membrane protein DedA with SNARE-associated domain
MLRRVLRSRSVHLLLALVNEYIQQFTYAGMLAVLVLCGFGLPVPEEATFLAAGYLVYLGLTDYWLTVVVCLVGAMTGDATMFLLGRRWGGELLGHPIMQKFITEAKLQKVRARFDEHRMKTIFVCRFLVGARAAAFFTAGSLGMGFGRFFLVDLSAALISVPLFVLIARHFGERVDEAARWMRNINLVAAGAASVVIVGVLLIAWKFRTSHVSSS